MISPSVGARRHEIVGVVTGVGGGVTRFKPGDTVGVGYFVGSCRSCDSCGKGNENYCAGVVLTSNGVARARRRGHEGRLLRRHRRE